MDHRSPVTIGTVDLSGAGKVGGKPKNDWEIYRDTLIEQAEQGVDYFTVVPGFSCRYIADRQMVDRDCLRAGPFWPNGVWRIARKIFFIPI